MPESELDKELERELEKEIEREHLREHEKEIVRKLELIFWSLNGYNSFSIDLKFQEREFKPGSSKERAEVREQEQ